MVIDVTEIFDLAHVLVGYYRRIASCNLRGLSNVGQPHSDIDATTSALLSKHMGRDGVDQPATSGRELNHTT